MASSGRDGSRRSAPGVVAEPAEELVEHGPAVAIVDDRCDLEPWEPTAPTQLDRVTRRPRGSTRDGISCTASSSRGQTRKRLRKIAVMSIADRDDLERRHRDQDPFGKVTRPGS